MKTLTWLATMLSLAACGPDIEITAADIFPVDYSAPATIIEGTVHIGSPPIHFHQAIFKVFRDSAASTSLFDALQTIDPGTGHYRYDMTSQILCEPLSQGLFIKVWYRLAPDDPFTELDVVPWVVPDYLDCWDNTLHAEDIVLTPPEVGPSVVTLLTPEPGAVLDNGCSLAADPIQWDFDWLDVAGATRYHLYVISSTAFSPFIDESSLTLSEFHFEDSGSVDSRIEWIWHVRAHVDGEWGAWTGRTFDVEPYTTDCP